MDAMAYFKGEKVTLMRIGLLGRGVGDAAFLAQCGAQVHVVDSAPQEQMQASVDALAAYPNITFAFGPYNLEDFRTCDFVLKGAGTPLDSPEIAEAKANGIPVRMSADLFTELAGIPVIGITGTRGKSTTTHFIHAAFEAAGRKTLLGGNVRGVSTLALLSEVTPEHTAILELDSWQLQGFREARLSPNIALFTTFFPDHLNYYHDDLVTYLDDKAQIFLNQGANDTLVLGRQVESLVREAYGDRLRGKVIVADEHDVPTDWKLTIPGIHNRYNAALARIAAQEAGIADEDIRTAFESFHGIPGRLEFLREVDGVKIYNDNNSTTPEAAIAALRAVGTPGERRIVLIMGGDEKSLDMNNLITELPAWCKAVVLFKERGTDRIRDAVFRLQDNGILVEEIEGLPECVRRAWELSAPGDTLLFSPAFSSFGKYFKNEYDRGDQFNALVNAL